LQDDYDDDDNDDDDNNNNNKSKVIPVRDRGAPYGCETSRLLCFLDRRLVDGAEVVSLTHPPPLPP
jgi:hypothetical protein